jgi:pimeloyl-ACP methyl ester carboxylesterase
MRLPALQVLLLAAGLVLSAAPSAGAAVAFAPCPAATSLQCASLDVPLDRSGQVAGTVRLAAVRRQAPARTAKTAVVALAGGPGQAATPLALAFGDVVAPALATRDLLVFDQRGTGASTPLRCAFFGTSLTAIGNRCAGELGLARGQYTTIASVEDLEALRAQIGYDKLVLYGVSYGTKVALEYASRHPDRVESLVLDSVVLPGGPDTLQRSTFAAMRRVLGELCASGACTNISRNPAADVAGQVKRLSRKPLRGRLTDGSGRRKRSAMSRRDLLNILLSGDKNPTLRAELPAALTSARRADPSPLLRLAARSAGIINLRRQARNSAFSDAVFAATLCEEGAFPWDRTAGGVARAKQAKALVTELGDAPFYPFNGSSALSTEIIELCVSWPVVAPPPAATGSLPNVPTLVINGAADLRTPLEDAHRITEFIPGAQVLVIPHSGHSAAASDSTEERCALRGVTQFFRSEPVTACAPSQNPFAPTPVAPTRLQRLPGIGGKSKVGRTISAAVLTAEDMRHQIIGDLLALGQLPSRAGGLRGGRVTVSPQGVLNLHDVVYVPGVEVSGRVPLPADGTQVLRIRGSAAARGRIVITPKTITGSLAGRRVSVLATAAGVTDSARLPSPGQLRRLLRLRPLSGG